MFLGSDRVALKRGIVKLCDYDFNWQLEYDAEERFKYTDGKKEFIANVIRLAKEEYDS